MVMVILYSSRFKRSFKKIPKELQEATWRSLQIFCESPFHPFLKTHKLSVGELWAFSVDYKNRVIFQFLSEDSILLINIGDHSVYRKIS